MISLLKLELCSFSSSYRTTKKTNTFEKERKVKIGIFCATCTATGYLFIYGIHRNNKMTITFNFELFSKQDLFGFNLPPLPWAMAVPLRRIWYRDMVLWETCMPDSSWNYRKIESFQIVYLPRMLKFGQNKILGKSFTQPKLHFANIREKLAKRSSKKQKMR